MRVKAQQCMCNAACIPGSAPGCRPDHTEEQLRAQRQHSLPETSPGKSPAGSGAFTPFRGLGALRARLGSLLQHASPSQPASPAMSHRDTPDDLSSDHVKQSMHSNPPGAPEASQDVSEQGKHWDGLSRLADDTR